LPRISATGLSPSAADQRLAELAVADQHFGGATGVADFRGRLTYCVVPRLLPQFDALGPSK
jgi:hypothetical protein